MNDFLLDESTLDILIKNGDFLIGNSTEQNQHLLLLSNKAEIKEFPKAGVGVNGYLLDETEQSMLREIRSQYESDGMKVKKLVYANGKINVDAPYNS